MVQKKNKNGGKEGGRGREREENARQHAMQYCVCNWNWVNSRREFSA
jgi:hypothetical protein